MPDPRNEPHPVPIRGTIYPSVRAAAAALDVDRSTIYAAERRGTLDDCGKRKRRIVTRGKK